MFSLLRAGWGKVNSLGIWGTRRVSPWLGTKCVNPYQPSQSLARGCLQVNWICRFSLGAFWAGTFTSLCCNPNSPCIWAQQTEISLLPCTTCFPNGPGSALYPNLSKPAIKWRCYITFLLGWKSRFLGSFSSRPAELYHEGQREDWPSLQRSKGGSAQAALCTSFKQSWESVDWPLNTLLFLKSPFLKVH